MDRLNAMAVFSAVADHGSVTRAAAALSLSKSQVSKQLALLEEHLGARLINRTTRTLNLTEAGLRFLEDCRRILAEVESAEARLREQSGSVRGQLRISAPLSFGLRVLPPILNDFLHRHDRLSIDLDLTDRRVNLVEENFDMALRIGELEDSSLVARKLCSVRMLIVGGQGYLDAQGRPQTAEDLTRHVCLNFAYTAPGRQYRFLNTDAPIRPLPGRLRANNGDFLVEAAAADMGLVVAPDFIAAPFLQAGRVISVLADCPADEVPVNVVHPSGRLVTAAQRAFIDHMVASLRDPPWRGANSDAGLCRSH